MKLHGFLEAITSERVTVFLSNFWQKIFALLGVQLNMFSAYHPQSDGQTELVNKCLKTYLRCFCAEDPTGWLTCLPMAEYWYNTNYHSSSIPLPLKLYMAGLLLFTYHTFLVNQLQVKWTTFSLLGNSNFNFSSIICPEPS